MPHKKQDSVEGGIIFISLFEYTYLSPELMELMAHGEYDFRHDDAIRAWGPDGFKRCVSGPDINAVYALAPFFDSERPPRILTAWLWNSIFRTRTDRARYQRAVDKFRQLWFNKARGDAFGWNAQFQKIHEVFTDEGLSGCPAETRILLAAFERPITRGRHGLLRIERQSDDCYRMRFR